MNPILYRYKDTESVVRAMDGYKPGDGWVPLFDEAAMKAATAAALERAAEVCDEQAKEPAWHVAPEREAFDALIKDAEHIHVPSAEKAWKAACAWQREADAKVCESLGATTNGIYERNQECADKIRSGA